MTITIYGLKDPREPDKIRYVGATQKPLRERLTQHCCEARSGIKKGTDNKRLIWIAGLFSVGIKPIIVGLRECTELEAELLEREFIQRFKANSLVNSDQRNSAYANCHVDREKVLTHWQIIEAKKELQKHWSSALIAKLFLERRTERTTQ